MFIFLFSGVYFFLSLSLTSVKAGCDVEVGIFTNTRTKMIIQVQDRSLVDNVIALD